MKPTHNKIWDAGRCQTKDARIDPKSFPIFVFSL